MKKVNHIYELIGHTPLVKLNRMVEEDMADIYLKLEFFNPGSSVKDRIALNMIQQAENEGLLKEGFTIIEPTSGNTETGEEDPEESTTQNARDILRNLKNLGKKNNNNDGDDNSGNNN